MDKKYEVQAIELMIENHKLHEENKLLLDFIKNLGIKISSELCEYKDWKEGWLRLKRVAVDRCEFVIPEPTKEQIDDWKYRLEQGVLSRLNTLEHPRLIHVDLTDKDPFEVKVFTKELKDGFKGPEAAEHIGVKWEY